MAAVISNQGGFYSTFAYVSEARRMGLEILPPDVNKSDLRWKGRAGTMHVGLLSIKHVDTDTHRRIVAGRIEKPYNDIIDFLERVQPNKHEARSLIHAGAFDSLHPKENRTLMLWELICWQKSRLNRSGTRDLFSNRIDVLKPSFPPGNERERLQREFAALGFLCRQHPMILYTDSLKKLRIVKARELPYFVNRHVTIAGMLITGKVVHTKHGEPMEFLTFEDDTGLIETTFFPKAYRRFSSILYGTRPFILYGRVEEDFGAVTMTVNRLERVKD
jgi:DNA polymerase-3 subunit alpha/error-prone DNA polymerase